MQLSRVSRLLMFVALPLLVSAGIPAAHAQDEAAPRARANPYMQQRMPARPGYGFRGAPAAVVPAPASRNGCGVFRYWNGQQCLDARDTPPKLD